MATKVADKEETRRAISSLLLVHPGINRTEKGREMAAPLISNDPKEQELVARGIHPDLIELASLPGKDRVGIAQVRDAIRQGQFSPLQGQRKVCLISYAETLTIEAANALLKILEEPPKSLVFLLLAENATDILPTVLSRSSVTRLVPPSEELRLARLTNAGYSEQDAYYLLTVFKGKREIPGSFVKKCQDIAALREQEEHRASSSTAQSLIEMLTSKDPLSRYEGTLAFLKLLSQSKGALAVLGARKLAQTGRKQAEIFLQEMLYISQDLLYARLSVPSPRFDERIRLLANNMPVKEVLRFSKSVVNALRSIKVYSPLETVLLSVLLAAGELANE